jgi:hypothetical protein
MKILNAKRLSWKKAVGSVGRVFARISGSIVQF